MPVRQEFDQDSPPAVAWRKKYAVKAFSYRDRVFKKKAVKRPPTCSRPGCANEKVPGEAFCPTCQAEGHTEDD